MNGHPMPCTSLQAIRHDGLRWRPRRLSTRRRGSTVNTCLTAIRPHLSSLCLDESERPIRCLWPQLAERVGVVASTVECSDQAHRRGESKRSSGSPKEVHEWAISFRADRRHLALGHPNGSIRIIQLKSGQTVRKLHVGVAPYRLTFHPRDGRLAVTCGNRVPIFDVDNGPLA
jgi:hypothetical protein